MQLSLPLLHQPPKATKKRRRAFTMNDLRDTRANYTEGWLKGPEMAKRLGCDYSSFKAFVKRNPELQKRKQRYSSDQI